MLRLAAIPHATPLPSHDRSILFSKTALLPRWSLHQRFQLVQGPADARSRDASRIETVTQQSAAVAASAVVLQVHAPRAEADLSQVPLCVLPE